MQLKADPEISNAERIKKARSENKALNVNVIGERVIVKAIDILPINKIGKLFIPTEGDSIKFDDHKNQGIIVAIGPEGESRGLKLFDHIYAKANVVSEVIHEGQVYLAVYLSDIICTIPKN
jgi:hypothetical protein